jgi:type VI secretion system protein ImpI/type VI secretion system protein
MTLVLTVLRCPDNAVPETRQVSGGEFVIGRSADASWRLADPLRAISKHHCMLCFLGGEWRLRDLSTNGTFVNRDTEPVGRTQDRVLQDGDRLHIGSYEIELRIESAAGAWKSAEVANGGDTGFGGGDALLPEDFDVLDDFAAGAAQSDHAAAIEQAFVPPTPARNLLPDESIDWLAPLAPEPAPPASAPAGPVAQAEPPPPTRRQAAVADAADTELMAAFLRGAGLGPARPENPAATMERLGAAFRAAVAGLRAVMIARASVKGEFRIEQTVIRARGNNPLKFSADDEDALHALLGLGRRTDVSPADAIAEALCDIRLHELAMVAAMQAATRALLQRLDPAPLRAEAERGGGGLLPVQRRARAFELYEALHASVTRLLADDFDSVFGRAFAQTYEQVRRETEDRRR